MLTLASVHAQNNFGTLIDHAQREMVTVTRRGRVAAYVMSPQVLEDYLEGFLATQAEKTGFATPEETQALVNVLGTSPKKTPKTPKASPAKR
jgi:prevent-host-death family protein